MIYSILAEDVRVVKGTQPPCPEMVQCIGGRSSGEDADVEQPGEDGRPGSLLRTAQQQGAQEKDVHAVIAVCTPCWQIHLFNW
jgi:hypothetical protein